MSDPTISDVEGVLRAYKWQLKITMTPSLVLVEIINRHDETVVDRLYSPTLVVALETIASYGRPL